MQRQRGLTLLELLVVLAIMGVCLLGVSLSLRDSSHTQLAREAQRLVAILEAARAQSRTSGIPLVWEANAEGFVIRSPRRTAAVTATNDPRDLFAPHTQSWLTADTQATVRTSTTASSSTRRSVVNCSRIATPPPVRTIAARSPGRSITGPDVALKFTRNSVAMM